MSGAGFATFLAVMAFLLGLIAIFYAHESIRKTKEFAEEHIEPLRKEIDSKVTSVESSVKTAQDRIRSLEDEIKEGRRDTQAEIAAIRTELAKVQGETAAIGEAVDKIFKKRRQNA